MPHFYWVASVLTRENSKIQGLLSTVTLGIIGTFEAAFLGLTVPLDVGAEAVV